MKTIVTSVQCSNEAPSEAAHSQQRNFGAFQETQSKTPRRFDRAVFTGRLSQFRRSSAPSDLVLAHLLGDTVGLADRQRDDSERGVLGGTGGELVAVGDEQVLDVVGLAVLVHHASRRIGAHPAAAEIVRRGVWRGADGAHGAHHPVHRRAVQSCDPQHKKTRI